MAPPPCPSDAFHKFAECEAAEVHLATEFQNLIYENPAFPPDFKDEIYKYLRKTCADEKKPGDTDEQFIYKTRKKAFGPFKRKFGSLAPTSETGSGRTWRGNSHSCLKG